MAIITYKSVIAKAINDFNNIQDTLSTLNAKYNDAKVSLTTATSPVLIPTEKLGEVILDQLQLKASGTYTITDNEGKTDISAYKYVVARAASNFSLAITDNSANDVTIGTVSGGYYPLTATLTGTLTAGTPGWFTSGSASHTSAVIGKIKQGVHKDLTSAEDSESLVITSAYEAGYLPGSTKTLTVSPATFGVENGSNSFTVTGNSSAITNATNIHSSGSVSLSEPTGGYFYAVNMTASGSKNIKSTSAGYVKNNKKIGTAEISGSDIAYVSLDAATVTVAGGGLTKTDYTTTPTVTVKNVGDSNMSNVSFGVSKTDSTYKYYFAVNAESAATSGNTKVDRAAVTDVRTAGFLPARSSTEIVSADSVSPTVTINKGTAETKYIGIKEATSTYSGGGLTATGAFNDTPEVSLSIKSQTTNGATIKSALADDDSFYVKLGGESSSLSGTTEVTRGAYYETRSAGYSDSKNSVSILGSGTCKANVTVNKGTTEQFLVLKKGIVSNGATADVTYIEAKAPELSGGFLYINEGYYAATKLSLGDLIPDIGDGNPIANYIRSGYGAYTEDGTLVTGTMADLALSTTYYTDKTGTTAGTGIADSVVTAGTYVAKNQYIKSGALGLSISANTSFKPTISSVDVSGSDGTSAANGDVYGSISSITTGTAPTSGHYFAVKSDSATAKTLTASVNVSTDGWLTNAANTSKSATVSLSESDVTYVSINDATITPSVVSLTAPSVKITTSVSGVKTTTTANSYKIVIKNEETNGSVSAKYVASAAGYIQKDKAATSAASSINPTVTIDGTAKASGATSTLYIQSGSVTNSVTSAIGLNENDATKSGDAAKITTSKPTTGSYVTFSATADATATKNEGYIVDGSVTATQKTAVGYIAATVKSSATNGAPSNKVDITAVTSYDAKTGEATKAYGASSGKTNYETSVTIDAVTAATNKYDNQYVIGYVEATSESGATAVTVGANTTGDSVDEYVEQLFKRMLGLGYTAVSGD